MAIPISSTSDPSAAKAGSMSATGPAQAPATEWRVVEQTGTAPPSWQTGEQRSVAPPPSPAWQPAGADATATLPAGSPYGYAGYGAATADATRAQPAYPSTGYSYEYDPFEVTGSRFTPLMGLLVLLAGAVVASLFFNVVKVQFDNALETRTVRSFSGFAAPQGDPPATVVIAIAAVVCVAAVAAIVLGAGYRRLGTGLGGGIGIAAAAWASLNLGAAVAFVDAADHQAVDRGTASFTSTWDVGFFVLAAVVVVGIFVFVMSLPGSSNDGLSRVFPLVSIVGAIGAAAMAAGPLIPVNGAGFTDNFPSEGVAVATIVARLASLVLIGFGAIVGFVNGRRWGLGIAAGSVATSIVLWAASLINPKGRPGIGVRNVGATDFAPHTVTTVGVILVLVSLLGAALLEQTKRSAARADDQDEAIYDSDGYATPG